jgi:hypothetical protein
VSDAPRQPPPLGRPRPPRDTRDELLLGLVRVEAHLEHLETTVAARMNAGASTIADTKHEVKEIRAEVQEIRVLAIAANAAAIAAAKPFPWKYIIPLFGILCGAVITPTCVAWRDIDRSIAGMPKREEFNAQRDKLDKLNESIASWSRGLVETAVKVDALEKQRGGGR